MPWQLVYTSAPRGLVSGQSGLCTVARSADLREALAQRLERISPYHYLEVATATSRNPAAQSSNPIISAYRILDLRGSKYHVLSRIQPCGLDFTARTNHIAHHLVFQPEELPHLPSPAVILRDWTGWLSAWQGEPRILDPLSVDDFARLPSAPIPAKAWQEITGDAGRAAGLLEGDYTRGCYLALPSGGERRLLDLYCETLQLPNWTGKYPLRSWQYTFTTFLQGEDAAADFQWRGCRPNTPSAQDAARRGASLIEVSSIRVPANPLAKFAREGPKPTVSIPQPQPPLGKVRLRRDPDRKPESPSQKYVAKEPFSASSTSSAPETDEDDDDDYVSINLIILKATIKLALLKRIGIVLILLLLSLGVLRYLQVFPFKPNPARTSGPLSNAVANVQPAVQAPAVATSDTVVSDAPVDPEELKRQLDSSLPDMATFLMLVPGFSGEFISLGHIKPLEELLGRVDKLDLPAQQIEMRYCCDGWGFPIRLPLTASFNDHQLAAVGEPRPEERITFTFASGGHSGDENSVQVRIQSAKPPTKALSVTFAPKGDGKEFQPFRILAVSEASPPPPLTFSRGVLDLGKPKLPDVFQETLRRRLSQFNPVAWELRPTARNTQCRDLYADWHKDERPRPGDELNFAAIKKSLDEKRQSRATDLAHLDDQTKQIEISDADRYLPFGKWLNLRQEELGSFKEFTKRRRSEPLAELYLIYLDKLSAQAGPRQWAAGWPHLSGTTNNQIAGKLQEVYEMSIHKLPDKHMVKLTTHGATTNYFLAVWLDLNLADKLEELERIKEPVKHEVARLNVQMGQLPASLTEIPCFNLCVRNSKDEPVPMIRFTATTPDKPTGISSSNKP